MREIRRGLLLLCLAGTMAGLLTLPAAASAGEGVTLLMVEEKACPYCARFNREIAAAYPNTAEGRLAPLVRVPLEQPWPEDYAGIRPETLTPTFILVADGVEVDRLHGYQGDEFFWFLLGEMLAKLPDSSRGKNTPRNANERD